MSGAADTIVKTAKDIGEVAWDITPMKFGVDLYKSGGDPLKTIGKFAGDIVGDSMNIGNSIAAGFNENLGDGGEVPEAPAAPDTAALAKQEEERKKKARLEEEQRLLAEHPGRGGVIANQAPTFRFM